MLKFTAPVSIAQYAHLETKMYRGFTATVVGSTDFTGASVVDVDVPDEASGFVTHMAVLTPTMEVHITREQARDFFGFKE